MKLSDYSIQQIAPYIKGDDYLPYRKGSELVKLFNKYGCRDVYDSSGLPEHPNRKNGQRMSRKEYAEERLKFLSGNDSLRQLLEQIVNDADNQPSFADDFNKILNPEGFSVTKVDGKYVIQGGVIDNTPPVTNEAHFENIQNQILAALDEARVSINVAMAWFTNKTLLNKLIEKNEAGIDVKVVIYDDEINRKHGVDLSKLEHTLVGRAEKGGKMHDKFCVIDNQIVITGSYNWTSSAEFNNDENITIQKDPKQASEYSVEFRKITQQGRDK